MLYSRAVAAQVHAAAAGAVARPVGRVGAAHPLRAGLDFDTRFAAAIGILPAGWATLPYPPGAVTTRTTGRGP